jgi:hypothetical protein
MLRFFNFGGVVVCVNTRACEYQLLNSKAGNIASANAEDTFQQLISQCDNIEVLYCGQKFA